MTLDMLLEGEKGIILNIVGKDALKLRLLKMGFVPETEIMMVKFSPFKNPVIYHIRGYNIALRLEDAQKIQIERIK